MDQAHEPRRASGTARAPGRRPTRRSSRARRPGSGGAGSRAGVRPRRRTPGSSASTINSGRPASTIAGRSATAPRHGTPCELDSTVVPDRADDLERHPGPPHFLDERVGDARLSRRRARATTSRRYGGRATPRRRPDRRSRPLSRGASAPSAPSAGDPLVQSRGENQARGSPDRNRDRRVDGVVPGSEGAAKRDDPDRGQKRDGEEAVRRALAGVSRVDREPDEDDAADPRRMPSRLRAVASATVRASA